MRPYRALLTFGTFAFTFGWGTQARAEDSIALSFDLEPVVQDDVPEVPPKAVAPEPAPQALVDTEAPLPIPPGAENPPMSGDTTWPAGVYGGVDAIALGNVQSVQALLPAPPPAPEPVQVAAAIKPVEESPEPAPEIGIFPEAEIDAAIAWNLDFETRHKPEEQPQKSASVAVEPAPTPTTTPTAKSWEVIQAMFAGGTDSLVARAVGSAEGTRTPEGHKNPAYFGHVDPGNGVWNLGTFSYQHGASTPEEADAKQLSRLQKQTEVLKQKAEAKGLELSQEELLNGIDLANQAPLAALDQGGYIDWLREAHNLGMTGSEAIVWARTRSFIDPDTQRWNAPGLGNNIYSISHDQERRANAIARAINATGLITQVAQVPSTLEPPQPDQPPQEAVLPAQSIVSLGFDLTLQDSVKQAGDAAQAVASRRQPTQEDAQGSSPVIAKAAEPAAIGLSFPDTHLPLEQPALSDLAIAPAVAPSEVAPEAQSDLAELPKTQPADLGGPQPVNFEADTLVLQAGEPATQAALGGDTAEGIEAEVDLSEAEVNLSETTPDVIPASASNGPMVAPPQDEATGPTEALLEPVAPEQPDDQAATSSPAMAAAELAVTEGSASTVPTPAAVAEADAFGAAAIAEAPEVANAPEEAEASVAAPSKSSKSSRSVAAKLAELMPALPFSEPRVLAPEADKTDEHNRPIVPEAPKKIAPAEQPDAKDEITSVIESLTNLQKSLREDR